MASRHISPQPDPTNILAVLRRGGLIGMGDKPVLKPLTGGVSSAIWRLDLAGQRFCIKHALRKLNVAADWQAPIERSLFEARWYEDIGRIAPEHAPRLIHDDRSNNTLIMEFLDPERHRLWKDDLMAGRIDPADAAAVGAALGGIHRATALSARAAQRFDSQRIFHDIRLEPYLLATIQIHPDLGRHLKRLAERTSSTRKCLIHGDVSPKNIMIAERCPVFLDAECAVYGDPAFDLAFCLNHLLLKRIVHADRGDDLMASFEALTSAYMARVVWEPRLELERRAAALLPALTLARIDGKSPVEYIDDELNRLAVREITRPMIIEPKKTLMQVARTWHEALDGLADATTSAVDVS